MGRLVTIIGELVILALVCAGVYWAITSIWIRERTDRYRFKELVDKDGQIVREVIDLEEDEVEIKRNQNV